MRVCRLAGLIGALALGALALPWPGRPAFSQGAGAQQVTCNKVAFVASVAAGVTTQVIAPVANQTVSICGFVASSVAASTVQFIYGTGTNCATGLVAWTAAANIGASIPLAFQSTFAFFSPPTGNGVCLTAGGTGPVNISISFAQY
jgi:hypothetical protein